MAKDGQFQFHLININETPVYLDCEVIHLPVVELDLPDLVLATTTTPALGPPTPAISNGSLHDFPPVEILEGNAMLDWLFDEFPHLMPSQVRSIGRINVLQHMISLEKDAQLVYIPAYCGLHGRRHDFEEQTRKLLELDLIEPGTSP